MQYIVLNFDEFFIYIYILSIQWYSVPLNSCRSYASVFRGLAVFSGRQYATVRAVMCGAGEAFSAGGRLNRNLVAAMETVCRSGFQIGC